MQAVRYHKSIPRYLMVRLLGRRVPGLCAGPLSLLSLDNVEAPPLPGPRWLRVLTRMCGICGSDMATIQAKGSPYFSPFTSSPFVLGHEIVGEVADTGPEASAFSRGQRVVIEPALSCEVRGIDDPCDPCRRGQGGGCERVTHGRLAPGIQLGYCRDTGGGWSPSFVAHESQLHPVPESLADEEAVLAEPFACALHAVLAARLDEDDTAVVIGGGTMGLLTIAAIRALGHRCRLVAVAKHPHQVELARRLGAEEVLRPSRDLYAEFCRITGAESFQPEIGKPVLTGGAATTFDCVGSATSIDDALRFTRTRGQVVLVGMPAIPRGVDWTSLWYKELEVRGAYTYGIEEHEGEKISTIDLALRLLERSGGTLRPLVTGRFPLADYRAAISHALAAGRTGAVKTVFTFDGGEASP